MSIEKILPGETLNTLGEKYNSTTDEIVVSGEVLTNGLLQLRKQNGGNINIPIPQFPNSILSGCGLSVTDTQATIQPGSWQINGITYQKATITYISIDSLASVDLNRIDAIVSNTSNTFQIVKGVEAENPATPSIGLNRVLVGYVFINSEGASVENSFDPSNYYTKGETLTLLTTKQSTSEKGAANGYVGLDSSSKIAIDFMSLLLADSSTASNTTWSSTKIQTALDALKSEILGGVGPAYDTLLELYNEIQSNESAIDSILTALSNRYTKTETFALLDDKANDADVVKSVSLNSGTPSTPDASGNVNISLTGVGVTDGDKTDIVVSSSGATWLIKASRILGQALTGLAPLTGTIGATDSIVQAFGKVQYFITNIGDTVRGTVATGLNTSLTGSASASDSFLQLFGKAFYQIANHTQGKNTILPSDSTVHTYAATITVDLTNIAETEGFVVASASFVLAFSNIPVSTSNGLIAYYTLSLVKTVAANIIVTVPSNSYLNNDGQIASSRQITVSGAANSRSLLSVRIVNNQGVVEYWWSVGSNFT